MRLVLFSSLFFVSCATSPSVAAPPPKEPYLCKYTLRSTFLDPASFQLRPGGPVFATITDSADVGAEFRIPFGSSEQGARLTFASGWVTMQVVYVAKFGFHLWTREPHRLSPVLTFPGGRVNWADSNDKKIVVSVKRPANLGGASSTWELDCAQTSIKPVATSGGDEALYAPDAGFRRATFDEGTRVPVSETAGGTPVETLTSAHGMVVLEETPDALHVHDRFGGLIIDGWVPRAPMKLRDAPEFSDAFAMGGLASRGGSAPASRCATKVPLMVRVEGEVHALGALRKNAGWKEVRREGQWVDIELPELNWVKLEPGVSFVISTESAAACAR